MFDEPFAVGNSPIHTLDPRVRIALAAACAISLSLLQHPLPALAGLAGAASLFAASRPPLMPALRRLLAVNLFILFLWLTVPFSVPGDPLLSLRGAELTRQGIMLALLVTIKANALVLLFLALVATMPSPTIGYALERLHFPPKLVFLFLFSCRYIHVIGEEWERLHTAARLRGFVPRTNGHTYRTVGSMLGMVFVRSFDRAVRVHEAMRLRGFCGQFRSTAVFRATGRDLAFAVLILVCLTAVVIYDFQELSHV